MDKFDEFYEEARKDYKQYAYENKRVFLFALIHKIFFFKPSCNEFFLNFFTELNKFVCYENTINIEYIERILDNPRTVPLQKSKLLTYAVRNIELYNAISVLQHLMIEEGIDAKASDSTEEMRKLMYQIKGETEYDGN